MEPEVCGFVDIAIVGALLLLPLVAGAFLRQGAQTADGARLFAQVLQRIEDNAVDSLSRNAIYEKAARGPIKNLKDPYADLYSPEEIASFQRNTLRNNYGGLGMQIEPQDDQIVVARVFPNSPAEAGGVLPGDHIIRWTRSRSSGMKLDQVSGTAGRAGRAPRSMLSSSAPASPQPIRGQFTRAIIRVPAVPYR